MCVDWGGGGGGNNYVLFSLHLGQAKKSYILNIT